MGGRYVGTVQTTAPAITRGENTAGGRWQMLWRIHADQRQKPIRGRVKFTKGVVPGGTLHHGICGQPLGGSDCSKREPGVVC